MNTKHYHYPDPCCLCAEPQGSIARYLCDKCSTALEADSLPLTRASAASAAADAAAEDARTYKAMAEAIVEGCTPTAQGFGGAA